MKYEGFQCAQIVRDFRVTTPWHEMDNEQPQRIPTLPATPGWQLQIYLAVMSLAGCLPAYSLAQVPAGRAGGEGGGGER